VRIQRHPWGARLRQTLLFL